MKCFRDAGANDQIGNVTLRVLGKNNAIKSCLELMLLPGCHTGERGDIPPKKLAFKY